MENCHFLKCPFISVIFFSNAFNCVQDPPSINADPETSGSSEWERHKKKYVSETNEHGSLSVISAKFEVSVWISKLKIKIM